MILKSSSILYLFDFDGTLVGNGQWENLFKSVVGCFRCGPYIRPSKFDIRWCILTGRPRIDRPIVWSVCKTKKLKPQQIFMLDTFLYHYKNDTETFNFKLSFMHDILNGKRKVSYTNREIKKIFYIDNDIGCISHINSNRGDSSLLAITVADFFEGKFDAML